MKYLSVKFITPDKEVAFSDVYSVSATGFSGEFMILPDHEAFLTMLRPGVVNIKLSSDDTIRKLFVINSVLEVNNNNCNIVADEAYHLGEIIPEVLEKRKKEVHDLLDCVKNQKLLEMAKKEISIIDSMLK